MRKAQAEWEESMETAPSEASFAETQAAPVNAPAAETPATEPVRESASVEVRETPVPPSAAPSQEPPRQEAASSVAALRKSSGIEPDEFQMDPQNLRNTIHIVVQAKGGTGKTFVATTLASFFQRHAQELDMYCFDIDSNRKSFSSFKSFNVAQFSEVSVNGNGEVVIDPTAFNGAFNPMLESIQSDAVVVIDTGAGSSFWSLIQYIRDLDYPTLAKSCGRDWRFIFHVVLSGADKEESVRTIQSLRDVIDNPFVEFVIWGNEFFGPLKDVYDRLVDEYGPMFRRNVNLPPVTNTDMKAAFARMRDESLSVTELFAQPGYSVIERSRINQYYYGNMARKPGVFRALQQLDWSPMSEAESS